MIFGFARENDDTPRRTESIGEGLYVVRNAYAGDYNYFEPATKSGDARLRHLPAKSKTGQEKSDDGSPRHA